MYEYQFRKSVEKHLHELGKKNPNLLLIVGNKVAEVLKNPFPYKGRKPLQHLKRIHIDKSFILVFSASGNMITFEDFGHHDDIYR
jgi:mRNA-degrading endonuclease RelE of RelBE toxin-antitoxin system